MCFKLDLALCPITPQKSTVDHFSATTPTARLSYSGTYTQKKVEKFKALAAMTQ